VCLLLQLFACGPCFRVGIITKRLPGIKELRFKALKLNNDCEFI
jgi:hypothetical protein